MEVRVLPAVHAGLSRYRITMPERPGHYAILEVPVDAEDPMGLVELFASSHLSLLHWATVEDGFVDDGLAPGPRGESAGNGPDQMRQEVTTG